jgi:hypothetical protein
MATDVRERLRRLALPAGLVALAVVLAGVVRLAILLAYEAGQLRLVGANTVLDRMSQLKPPPWKGPFLVVTLDATILVVAVCVVVLFVVGIRRALPSKPRA